MSTIRQIQANQQNAQHSTGPRSVEGKAAVSRNALKSGIDAKSMLIFGETAADLAALQTEYFDCWLPTTPDQRALVDALVEYDWLMRRYRRLETHVWNHSIPDATRLRPNVYLSQTIISGDQIFDRVLRHKNAAQRNYRATLRDLQRLKEQQQKEQLTAQNQEPAAPPESAPPPNPTPIAPLAPQPIEIQPTSTPTGFVPANSAGAAPIALRPPANAPIGAPLDS